MHVFVLGIICDLKAPHHGAILCPASESFRRIVPLLNIVSNSAGQHFSVVKPSSEFCRTHGGTYMIASKRFSAPGRYDKLRVSNWTKSYQSFFSAASIVAMPRDAMPRDATVGTISAASFLPRVSQ